MSRIAYYRVSTSGQTIEAQRNALPGPFEREFADDAISGLVQARRRPEFQRMLDFVRDGDTLHVFAIDRLGRDAIDIQQTVRALLDKGVTLEVRGLGTIARGVGELIVAVLAQIAQMERSAIAERTAAGRTLARASLEATGRTHRGKAGLGRPPAHPAAEVCAWRRANQASLTRTAAQFGISVTTVKRYMALATATKPGKGGDDIDTGAGGTSGPITEQVLPIGRPVVDADEEDVQHSGPAPVHRDLAASPVSKPATGGSIDRDEETAVVMPQRRAEAAEQPVILSKQAIRAR